MDLGILEACGIVAALSAGLGGPVAVIRWCSSSVDRKISESEKAITITTDTHGHKLANVSQRLEIVERARVSDVERIVKLETNLHALEKGQERIEHQLEKMEERAETGRAEIIDSIREMSKREIKD